MNNIASGPAARIGTTSIRFYVFIGFLVLVFLTGGSSRGDMTQVLFIRPMAILAGAYALILLKWSDFKSLGAPLWLLLALIGLVALQLVPLPPGVWYALPGREVILTIDEAVGLGPVWRPLTMSPSKTWNTFFALLVPLSALLLYASQTLENQRKTWVIMLTIAVVSALWGILQITAGPQSALYYYRITNNGSAVGFFANRNHHGVFMACMIITASWYFASLDPRKKQAGVLGLLAIGAIVIFLPTVLMAGSRAGLIASAIATLIGLFFIAFSRLIPAKVSLPRQRSISGKWLVLGFAGIFTLLTALAVSFSRALALDRLLEKDATADVRSQLLPVFEQMIDAGFPYGFGFGSFEYVYKAFEPLALLNPKYLNQAHNDLAQWVIEGGVAAITILVLFGLWLMRASYRAIRDSRNGGSKMRIMAVFIIALLLSASLVDYPLRVPSLMVVFALACARLSISGRKSMEQ